MFARTERLLLRPAWAEDSHTLFRAIGDERIVRNLATAPWPYMPEHAACWTQAARSPDRPAALIFKRDSGAPELIGGIGIHDTPDGAVELGYWIARTHWGRGYATEAGRAVVDMARHGIGAPRLHGRHMVDNPASGGVLRKLGFVETGTGTIDCLARGAEVACVTYELDLSAPSLAIAA